MATPPDFTAGQVLTAAQMNQIGLWKITPTSVSGTGASIDSDGSVVVTSGGTNVVINGVFSNNFDSYRFVVEYYRASSASSISLSLGTAAPTGTAYKYSQTYSGVSGGVTVTGSGANASWDIGIVSRGSTRTAAGSFDLFNPYLSEETAFVSSGVDVDDTGATMRHSAGFLLNDTSYTACRMDTAGANFTALKVSIYGYN